MKAPLLLRSVLLASLALLGAVTLAPFLWLLCSSLKSPADFFTSPFLPPGDGFAGIAWDRLSLRHYLRLWQDPQLHFARGLLNSAFYASVTAVSATAVTSMAGYALACTRFSGRRPAGFLVVFTLMVPPILLLAPGYRVLFQLGLLDSYAGLILPAAAPAFGVLLFRAAFRQTLPPELLEAARLDGCGEFRLFFQIALPLVRPMTGAFLMITFLACWNNFLAPQIVLQTPEKFPLAVTVAQLKGLYSMDYGLLMAGTTAAIAPVMLLFLLLQKDFLGGLTAGAVKG